MCIGLVQKKQRMVMSRKAHHTEYAKQLLFSIAYIVKWNFVFSSFTVNPNANVPNEIRKIESSQGMRRTFGHFQMVLRETVNYLHL